MWKTTFARFISTVSLLTVALMSSTTVFAQDTYYYKDGEKVPLKYDQSKLYVLFKGEIAKDSIANKTKQNDAVLKRLEPVASLKNIEFTTDQQPDDLTWAIIENVGIDQKVFQNDNGIDNVVYKAPFVITPKGDMPISHFVYVKLSDKDSLDELYRLSDKYRFEIVGHNTFMPEWYTLSCGKDTKGNALEIANTIYEEGKGAFAKSQPDFMADYQLKSTNDEFFDKQWGLSNTGQHGGTTGIDIGIVDAWNITEGDQSVVVAVLDHGVELNHPDLPNMFASSFDTVNGTSPSVVRGSHGTACAGIIGAARNNNTLGVAGIAPDSQVMSISDRLRLGPNAQQNLANGLSWAWQNGADVISNSWGHNALSSPLIDDAIDDALTQGRNGKGCVVVFAAGNDNGPVSYPASSNSDILVVGAMSPCGERKSPSSCDPETFWGSNYGDELDILAPGVLIPTTDRQGSSGYDSGDYAMKFNGTSSACPHVAAVASLILSIDPSLTQAQVAAIIESNAEKVGSYNYVNTAGRPNGTWHHEAGYGLLDAHACVQTASIGASQTDISGKPASPAKPSASQPQSAHGSANAVSAANYVCRVKFLNSAPEQVIRYIGAKFVYDDGSISYDPPSLPRTGLKRVNIAHGEAGYCFSKNKCVKKVWVALTWTSGSGAADLPDAPAGKCATERGVELAPARNVSSEGKDATSFYELVIDDFETGGTRRIPIELSEEGRKAVEATKEDIDE